MDIYKINKNIFEESVKYESVLQSDFLIRGNLICVSTDNINNTYILGGK